MLKRVALASAATAAILAAPAHAQAPAAGETCVGFGVGQARHRLSIGRVDAARISTVGNSTASPVTTLAECPDAAPTARQILCLQPDRRVEIGVTGTR